LHGFPSSSHMYRNLIVALQDKFNLIAPDYPGFGNSDNPLSDSFSYTFDNLAKIMEHFIEKMELEKISLYVQDYGAPIGFRIASKHPKKIQSLIIQNGNAYEEGIGSAFDPIRKLWKERTRETEAPIHELLKLKSTKNQYLDGAHRPEKNSPDSWNMDQYFLDRPGNADIQIQLQYDYQNNLKRYEEWHIYFRNYQPPTLIVWGKNDKFFIQEGALAYKRDLKDTEVHLLDTGHFALEEEYETIANRIIDFFKKKNILSNKV
ncbi:MAG TPA: alpha/beta hydrolase, partial [Nitrososphaeraceae archaeon]|nr:alpha/beta hydrolase [Nitrososphaeraceae archaeon]